MAAMVTSSMVMMIVMKVHGDDADGDNGDDDDDDAGDDDDDGDGDAGDDADDGSDGDYDGDVCDDADDAIFDKHHRQAVAIASAWPTTWLKWLKYLNRTLLIQVQPRNGFQQLCSLSAHGMAGASL